MFPRRFSWGKVVCDTTRRFCQSWKMLTSMQSSSNPSNDWSKHLGVGMYALMSWSNVTSQNFNLECYTLDHQCISYLFSFGFDPRNFYATQGPTERVGKFFIFIFEFSQILRIGSFDFYYFITNYFYYKNMREGIKWISQIKKYWGFNNKIK